MSIQPYRGSEVVVVEARHADGSLNVQDDTVPREWIRGITFDALYSAFFRANPEAVGTWESLSAWLKSKGWSIRAKTWTS